MSIPGPAPSENRRRRNADTFSDVQCVVNANESVDAPELPDADTFSQRTRKWYATWASSPQAQSFTPTDWQRLHMLAFLVNGYFADPSEGRFKEIRQNESLLGATHLDRLKGRIKVVKAPVAVPSNNVSDMDELRRSLIDDDS